MISASTLTTLDELEELYGSIVKAGTHSASSIKVAEAAKAIENARRDVNISFVNELALIFDKMGIDTREVLDAASTSGRNVNDKMGGFIAQKVIKLIIRKQIRIAGSKVLILGFTFKENCSDTRNTKVVDVVRELLEYNVSVDVYDPYACRDKTEAEYGIDLMQNEPDLRQYDGIILTVGHDEFAQMDLSFMKDQDAILFDVRGVLPRLWVDGRL